MARKTKIINLALQGGGAHGALAWGVLDKLLEDGRIEFDSISATSAGAMNAVILTQGIASGGNRGARELLHRFWKEISDVGQIYSPVHITQYEQLLNIAPELSPTYFLFDMMTKLFSPYQFNPINFNPLRDILESMVDFKQVRTCKSPRLHISATNVRTGKIKVFNNEEISLDAIMASSCLPYLFQSVNIGSESYWDGGYMGNPALYPLIYNSKSPDILIVHINPIQREEVPQSASEIINRINEISFNSSLMREMRAIAFVSKMLDEGWLKEEYAKKMKRMFIHAIRADKAMEESSVASKFNTDWEFILLLHDVGRELATTWLEQNFNHLGVSSSIDINEYL
ncbi:patatin-like phospholipase family protein [Legionella spiritensis]|uniref:patatin-like phospholipase family protein n=1 Tax=Legionella spiritensis TaxID=452 RepID=UPI000F6E3350|nr:patatin-like phospholipase family protein [Legionella spiritensis]VEG91520.1 esterase [Legionella spiritensis]